jgi:hypothetical protein
MATQSSIETPKVQGPSGFIELGGAMLLVDYGRVYHEANMVGYLFEDGYLKNTSGPLGNSETLKAIEEIPGCIFRGIDSSGMELELPGLPMGPSGALCYNGINFHVSNGRICTHEHQLVGHIDDQGVVYTRDRINKEPRRKLDETVQLTTQFKGKKSNGEKWEYEFIRKLPQYRKDKSYSDNEIIRYFRDYDTVNTAQKKYVIDSLRIWSSSGILQIVRKSEGDAALGNVKHGAAGVTGVRTGMVHLDKEEFEKEITLFKRFGAVAVLSTHFKPHVEVRVNLVVAHEFGHQLEFVLSQKTQEQIQELYEQRKKQADKLHPAPSDYEGGSELVTPEQVFKRIFVSGYSRSSWHEYWAECVAVFSVREGRDILKAMDPAAYDILVKVIFAPHTVMRPVFHDTMQALQSSLRLGGEFTDKLLDV